MNQRLHNLGKWRHLSEGKSICYPNERQRTVIVDVNCPDEVSFYVVQDRENVEADPEKVMDEEAGRAVEETEEDPVDDGRVVQFLALCKGRDRLEFAVEGAFELMVEGGSAYVYTVDSQDVSTKIVAPVIFTRIANRRQRNPHLEMVEYQMKLNVQRMHAELAAESERRLQALEEKYAPQRVYAAPARGPVEAEGRSSEVSPGRDGDVAEVAIVEDDRTSGKPPRKRASASAPVED